MGILIEHYAGAFPFWMAPFQVRLLPVKEDFLPWASSVEATLKGWGVRVEVDRRDEKLGKKIRDAQLQKVPFMIVIGEREAESGQVSVRERSRGDLGSFTLEAFRQLLLEEFNPLDDEPSLHRCVPLS